MKSRHRPPLILSDPEPEAVFEGDRAGEAGIETETEADALVEPAPAELEPEPALSLDPLPDPSPPRPLSERRRRRLLEEQRQAELAAQAEAEAASTVMTPTFAESAEAPPAPYSPQAPAPARLTPEPVTGGRHAYLMAGLASALWVGGVASWAAYEIGSGAVAPIPCGWPCSP